MQSQGELRICKDCQGPMVTTGSKAKWVCKPCHKTYMERWHEANPRQKTARRPGKCSKCGADKPKGTYCKPCNTAWRRANYHKKNTRTPVVPGRCTKCGASKPVKKPCKPCRNKYLATLYVANSELYLERNRRWKRNNPDALKAQKARRRARELNAEGEWSRKDIAAIRKKQKGRCAYCQCKLTTTKEEHIDHVHPLSKDGTNWPINLQILCEPCNLKKHAKIPEIAQPSLFGRALSEGLEQCQVASAVLIPPVPY